jgi:peptidyl-prolyl cis-trans isomerase A (cyclophilin A)
VFRPPPALPEEAEAERAAKEARAAAVAAGRAAEQAEGESKATRPKPEAGEAARPGMSAQEIKEHAISQGDPAKGEFSLEQALDGLEGEGKLWVKLVTARGLIECELFEEKTPRTVANFVGLARGLRPFKDPETGEWIEKPYYNGTTFHRVIPGFMIQGGDPLGTGMGNPGYVIEDEVMPDIQHDAPGRLSMANRGPNTGSAQFFITLGPTHHLDGKHTIFGQCNEAGMKIADDIALVPRGPDDVPTEPEAIRQVEVFRR